MAWWTMATEWAVSRPGSPASAVAGMLRCGGPFEHGGEARELASAIEDEHHRDVVRRGEDPELYDAVVHRWLVELRFGPWLDEHVANQVRLGVVIPPGVVSAKAIGAMADVQIALRHAAALERKAAARAALELEPDDQVVFEVDCHGLWRFTPRYVQRECTCLVTEWWLIVLGAPTSSTGEQNPARVDIPLDDVRHLRTGGGHGYRRDGRPTCFLEVGTERHGFYGVGFGAIDDPDDWTPARRLEEELRRSTGLR